MTYGRPFVNKPHILLEPLLKKHDISWEDFTRKGRLPQDLSATLKEKRSAVITDLHNQGLTWKQMVEATGLSNGAIQRGTHAVGNAASKENRRASAAKVGSSRKGEKKPWLSKKLRDDWSEGKFNFHLGRKVSPEGLAARRRASARPEVKARRSEAAQKRWANPKFRQTLLDYHRSPENRNRQSALQAARVRENPEKWARGKGGRVPTEKSQATSLWVRSSYEKEAVLILEADPTVLSYVYEPRFKVAGRTILPDFLVVKSEEPRLLVEVKASWVKGLPCDHTVTLRLGASESLAKSKNWDFQVWTEKDVLKNVVG